MKPINETIEQLKERQQIIKAVLDEIKTIIREDLYPHIDIYKKNEDKNICAIYTASVKLQEMNLSNGNDNLGKFLDLFQLADEENTDNSQFN